MSLSICVLTLMNHAPYYSFAHINTVIDSDYHWWFYNGYSENLFGLWHSNANQLLLHCSQSKLHCFRTGCSTVASSKSLRFENLLVPRFPANQKNTKGSLVSLVRRQYWSVRDPQLFLRFPDSEMRDEFSFS